MDATISDGHFAEVGDGIRLHVRTQEPLAQGDTARLRVPVERALVYPPE